MKLKDILKTDTDNKGWLRVFKKLGADAEMLKYVNENISKSGGGGGTKEYCYKIIDEVATLSMLELIKGFSYGELIMTSAGKTFNGAFGSFYDNCTYTKLLAFKIYDIEVLCFNASDNVFNKNFGPFNGDVYERMCTYMGMGDPEISVEEIKAQMNNVFIEITKEEYESMITYKP